MSATPNLGVFLNDSPADGTVLEFARVVARVTRAETIHFIHFRERGIADKLPDPTPEVFESRIRAACPDLPGRSTTCEIIPKTGVKAILRSIRDRDLDLVIVGRRLPSDQMAVGSTFKRLAIKSPCSVLVITEYSQPHFERFLIPTDLSEHSGRAVTAVLDIARTSDHPNPEIILQHNIAVGYGYQYSGVSFEEFARDLEENAMVEVQRFLEQIDAQGFDIETVITCSDHIHEAVTQLAVARKMDLVVVGSRGVGSPLHALLGDTAERILMACPLPVLIVKQKGETLGILDAILKE
jgi:nucleotide-binding universal stress UspA family protein